MSANKQRSSSTNLATKEHEQKLIEKWLDLQTEEMRLQSENLQLRNREIDNNHQISKRSIEANLQNVCEDRTHKLSLSKFRYVFWGIALVIVLIFASFIAYLNKEQLLSEWLSLILEFGKYVVGAVVGYSLAILKGVPNKGTNSSEK